jgi:hypothetical protein
VKEEVVTFGPEGILVGILTEPDEGGAAGHLAVVMSNVGLNHRVGPSRAWVDIARRLAGQGIASLRFDASGLGDSAPREDRLGDIERSILDLEDAVAWLATERQVQRVVLLSMCSGTDNAHVVAVRDRRVVGAVFIEGYAYATPVSTVYWRVLRYADPFRWRRAMRRRFPEAFGLHRDLRGEAVGWIDEIFHREYPTREKFETDLATMVDRGVRLLFVYTQQITYLYKRQFWDWLRRKDWGGQVAVEYYPRADHVFRFQVDRETMMAHVTRWVLALARELPSA